MIRRHLLAAACLACLGLPARAALLIFDPASISPSVAVPSNPGIVVGNGTVDYLQDAQMQPILPEGVATAGNDGYEIQLFTYIVTAAANPNTGQVTPLRIDWLSSEKFASAVATDITVTISGTMTVNFNAGTLTGQVAGLVDSNFNPSVIVNFPPPPMGAIKIFGPANEVIPWNDSGVKMNVAPGADHTLEMFTSIAWSPQNVGDKLTITGSYQVTASAVAVPEPSGMILLGAAAVGMVPLARRRRLHFTSKRPFRS